MLSNKSVRAVSHLESLELEGDFDIGYDAWTISRLRFLSVTTLLLIESVSFYLQGRLSNLQRLNSSA